MAHPDPHPAAAAGSVYPAHWEADVLLRDGHPVHIRPIRPTDGDALRAFHLTLSERTVYFRFFAIKPELSDVDVEYFTGVDYDSRTALVAIEDAAIIAVARYDAIGSGTAEVAFVIQDVVQGLGLGSVLLEHLTAAARERGITRFTAEVLPENARMLAVFREAGYEITQRREDDVVAVSFDIEPTSVSLAVTAAREHRAEARSVQRLLQPAGVAVVGASRSPGGLGHAVLRHVVDARFGGTLVAVHPEVDVIAGVRCVRSLVEVTGEIELAVVVVPAGQVADVVRDAAAAQVHGIVVVSGGFGDTGGDGPRLQEELVALINRAGMRLVGPNALGLINTDPAVRLNASLVPHLPPTGSVGFFSQSGALGGSILARFAAAGVGVSTFVSAGNRADISGNDVLQYWREDPATTLVALYLETIGNARKFARIVHSVARDKPVIMVRTGGSGQQHPMGHAVGRTQLNQHAVDQILRDCGLIVVDSVDAMIDLARVAAHQPRPTGSSVAIVSNSDALAVLAVNGLEAAGLALAGTPVSFARQGSAEAYASAVRSALQDEAVGVVLAIHVPPIEHPSGMAVRRVLRDLAVNTTTATLIAVVPDGTDAAADGHLPVFADIEDALHAAGAWVAHANWCRADERRRAEHLSETVPDIPAQAPGTLAGADAADLVRALGVPLDLVPDAYSSPGARIRVLTDPVFGAVVILGVDDPVAEALDDISCRLAPVVLAGAQGMVADLGARAVLGAELESLAALVSAVSRLPSVVVGVTVVDVRHVTEGPSGRITATDVSITVSAQPAEPDPAARRL